MNDLQNHKSMLVLGTHIFMKNVTATENLKKDSILTTKYKKLKQLNVITMF